MNTRHDISAHTKTSPRSTNSSLQYGHQSQTSTTRKHPPRRRQDAAHGEFHHSHGIRQQTRGVQQSVDPPTPTLTEYAEIYQDVESASADTHTNTASTVLQTGSMAIANETCVSFCNQPKARYLATSRESRRHVVAGAGSWLRQESLRHILASPGYAPGTIAINFT